MGQPPTRHRLYYSGSDCAPAGTLADSQVARTIPLIVPYSIPVCRALIEIVAVVASASVVVVGRIVMQAMAVG